MKNTGGRKVGQGSSVSLLTRYGLDGPDKKCLPKHSLRVLNPSAIVTSGKNMEKVA